jgi:cell division protein FtsQ
MWDNPRQLNMVALIIALSAFVMLACAAAAWLGRQPAFAFRQVLIHGPLNRVNPAHLEAVVREELRGTFFTMHLDDARASLQKAPWVRRIALRRQWPNRLEVDVTEHEPLARWNDAALVDSDGELFNADFDGELPQFIGPDGSVDEVTTRFRSFGAALQPLGLTIDEIRLSSRGGWQISTADDPPLTIELGRTSPGDRLLRFAANYGQTVGSLVRAGKRVDYADLRYRSGFALRGAGLDDRPGKKTS